MRRTLIASLSLASALSTLACGDAAVAPEARVAVVGSYNVGLAVGYVDYASQRRPALAALIAGLDADLLCLEEVWSEEDIDAIVQGAASRFPHAYSAYIQDTTVGPPACEVNKVTALRGCVELHCAGVPAGELGTCVLEQCQAEFFATGAGCQGCLAANLGKPFDDIFDACTTGSALYTYGGANGLLILSKVPLTATAHLELDSSLTQRSVLRASVTLPRLGAVDFYCTHLAADLSDSISYNGDYLSFEGENVHQTEQILAYIASTARPGALPILAGDFNSGPALGELDAELPAAAYQGLTTAGWTSLVVAAATPQCSFCADNLLVADDHASALIDHVWVKGLDAAFEATATRLGTAPITIDDGGTAVTTHPSDHYGVLVQFDYAP